MSEIEKETSEVENSEADKAAFKMPPANFLGHISQLAMQALVYLGQIPHPVDQKTIKDMDQAKYLMDTLELLKAKTEGNLTDEEEDSFGKIMYDVRIKFVEASQEKEPQV